MGDICSNDRVRLQNYQKMNHSKKPPSNFYDERVPQTHRNIIQTCEVNHSNMTMESPWDGI